MLCGIGVWSFAIEEEKEIAGEGTADVGEQGFRPKREVHELRGIYGPEQKREPEGRYIRCRKCEIVVREGISEFYLWDVE